MMHPPCCLPPLVSDSPSPPLSLFSRQITRPSERAVVLSLYMPKRHGCKPLIARNAYSYNTIAVVVCPTDRIALFQGSLSAAK